jgi:hypothetical protein
MTNRLRNLQPLTNPTGPNSAFEFEVHLPSHGDGTESQQVTGSSTFTCSYEGLNILYEKNVTGSTTTVTKHFYADGLQVAKMMGTGTYYLHEDAIRHPSHRLKDPLPES